MFVTTDENRYPVKSGGVYNTCCRVLGFCTQGDERGALLLQSSAAMALTFNVVAGSSLLPSNPLRTATRRTATPSSTRISLGPRAEFHLRPLPYELDALEPHMSKRTLEYHWGKHHRSYVENLNKQIEGADAERHNLSELVLQGYNNGNPLPYFNNAGQVWNHEFFWSCMCRDGGGEPPAGGELLDLIAKSFGSFEEFAEEFKKAGASQFGSGWVWLVLTKDAKLEIIKTSNALTPIVWDYIPLLVVDVWEHAYYLDYQNKRPDYLTEFMDHLVSWQAVSERLDRARAFVNIGEPVIPEV
jgi:Fe-Mn family superoxide dismutase